MNIIFTRHGQTNWNIQGKVQGTTDIELNDTGREQAKETAKKLSSQPIDLIICSPLKRTKETAEIIGKGRNIPIKVDDRVVERCFGKLEGKTREYIDMESIWNYDKNTTIEDGESVKVFFDRIYDFFDDIKEQYKGKNILVVSHGGVGIPVRYYFNNEKPEGRCMDLGLGNCEYVKYSID